MSQENVEALRAVYEEWAKGNFAAGGDLWDRRVLFIPMSDLPDVGDYLGPEGVTAFMGAFLQAWTNFTIAAEELIEARDSVVVVANQQGAGRESGIPAELPQQFHVWTFRGRAVIRFEAFQNRAEALEAVGLRE
jgi:ketosteroid isomerase-like protein